jgi:hypothetical protein
MYDFWYALGTAVIDPAFLNDLLVTGQPQFTPVPVRVITEQDGTGAQTAAFTNKTTAGLLEINSCTAFRNYVRQRIIQFSTAAPPISIYTAGRFSQLLCATKIGFKNLIGKLTTLYKSKSGNSHPAAAFVAAIGVCIIDQRLATQVALYPGQPIAQAFFVEFGITSSTDQTFLSGFCGNQAFTDVQKALLKGTASTDTPWQDICPDQYLYWAPQNDRAII